MINHYRFFTVGNKRHNSLLEAAKSIGNVTFNRNYKRPQTMPHKGIFGEILIRMRPFNKEKKHLIMGEFTREQPKNLQTSAKEIVKMQKKFLRERWDSSALHMMPLSGGVDSKNLALMLKQIRNEMGGKSFGDIIFYVFPPECSYAETAWKAIGWEKNSELFKLETGKVIGYWDEMVDFRMAGQMNSIFSWPTMNIAFDRAVKRAGVSRSNIQVISAMFADECTYPGWKNVNQWLAIYPRHLNNPYRGCSNWLFPWLNYESFSFFLKHTLKEKRIPFKNQMTAAMNPDLVNVPNYNDCMFDHTTGKQILGREGVYRINPWWWISRETREKAERDYAKSWYSKTIAPMKYPLPPAIAPLTEWRDYKLAAICEAARRAGCTIQ